MNIYEEPRKREKLPSPFSLFFFKQECRCDASSSGNRLVIASTRWGVTMTTFTLIWSMARTFYLLLLSPSLLSNESNRRRHLFFRYRVHNSSVIVFEANSTVNVEHCLNCDHLLWWHTIDYSNLLLQFRGPQFNCMLLCVWVSECVCVYDVLKIQLTPLFEVSLFTFVDSFLFSLYFTSNYTSLRHQCVLVRVMTEWRKVGQQIEATMHFYRALLCPHVCSNDNYLFNLNL